MSLDAKTAVLNGKTALGIEFGSTRIKAVLIDEENKVIAQGNHDWENRLETVSGPTAWRISGQACRTATQIWQRT